MGKFKFLLAPIIGYSLAYFMMATGHSYIELENWYNVTKWSESARATHLILGSCFSVFIAILVGLC